MPYPSFAALGDSFTEGLDDPYADGRGFRGWADRVAEQLAVDSPDFRYANLAVRGRLLGPIVRDQVPIALTMRPALVSLAGGTNDALRRGFDGAATAATLREGVHRLTDAGLTVLLFTGTDPSRRLPGLRRLLPRVQALNDAARRTAEDFGCLLVDLWPAAEVFDAPQMWSEDRLHLSSEGHRRIAGAVLETLGAPADDDWCTAAPAAPPLPWRAARGQDVRWLRTHVGPWLHRRATGRSSGDAVLPKRPELERVRAD